MQQDWLGKLDDRLPLTSLGREIVSDRQKALDREWVITNGIGGFGGASLSGALTRRYHGLLVAALQPPLGRTVLLSKMDERIEVAGQVFQLDVNEWRDGSSSLSGLFYLEKTDFHGTVPTFVYRLPGGALHKTCWMEYGANTTYIRYEYNAGPSAQPLEIQVRVMANCRDYHEDTKGSPDRAFKTTEDILDLQSWTVEAWPGAPRWQLLVKDKPAQWRPEGGGWYWGFHYRQEQNRGLTADEDLYCIGTWVASLAPGQSITYVATVEPPETVEPLYPGSLERELARQQSLLVQSGLAQNSDIYDRLATRLTLAADQFVVGRPDHNRPGFLQTDYRTVIAGYPWFSDWGRDTMIALPGLAVVTGRYGEAALILRSFARYVSQGMLPNRFPDPDPAAADGALRPLEESDYNTVDASVWYFDAVQKYLEATGDDSLVQELYPVLADMVRWHVKGTRFGIKVDPQDGLLASGGPGLQLTWMDVKIDDWVVTPRSGKPIEISALWYRACRVMENLALRYGKPEAAYYQGLAARVVANFEKTYWNPAGGYFYDCINPDGQPDASLRPNQAIALAVAPELVRPELRQAALAVVKKNLLTPYGLRTLNRENPDYKPEYKGGRFERDSAYHQGTIWPWLLGPYALALLKDGSEPAASHRAELESLLQPFLEHIDRACIGQISEVFGAEPPFPPGGCFAQAWSVSQLLEIWRLRRG